MTKDPETSVSTPEQIEMARACAAKYWQTGDHGDEATARMILSGAWDDQAYVQAALAAIIETQEACAKLAEDRRDDILADYIRTGNHYGKASHDPR